MKTKRLGGWLAALSCSTVLYAPTQLFAAEGAEHAAEEIIVTAQRRAERLIDVPATVTALTAESLSSASISSTLDLAQMTPGLQVSNTGAYTQFALRGVSSETSGPGADNNVAIYVDDVYTPSKNTGIFDFPDVESVEVLKGPQGTLYGRNATGGAILFKTAAPTFKTAGKASASYGSYNEREFKATASTGIVPDVLAGSLSGYYKKDDGYLNNLLTGKKTGAVESWLMRGKLLFIASDNVKITLAGYHSYRKDTNAVNYSVYNRNTNGVFANPNAIISGYGQVSSNYPSLYRNRTTGFTGRVDVETGIGQLSLVSGYTDVSNKILTDGDSTSAVGTDFLTVQPQTTFSQDINFASRKFGSFSFLSGASYFHDVGKWDPVRIYSRGIPILDIDAKVKTEALAAYIDGDYAITDKLSVSGGVRWTTEKKNFFGGNNAPTFPYIGAKRWSNVTPRAAVRYALTENANVYASYSRGFKSGLFNSANFTGQTVRPETVDAFEAGIKAGVGGQITFGAAVFYYNYKDIQVVTFQGLTQALQNAAKARLYGVDIDVVYQPMPDLTIRAAVSPLSTKYKDYTSAVVLVPRAATLCPPGFAYCGNVNASKNLTGNQLSRAPKLTATGSISYTLHEGNQSINFFANLYYTSKFYWDASNRIGQGAYALVNGRISWNINNGPFSIEFWGRNLTDKKYYVSSGINSARDGFVSARPRTVGGTVKAEF